MNKLLVNNKRFLSLFVKNAMLIFSGIAVLLVAVSIIIYVFASRQLVREVDAASRRGLETALSTVDAVLMSSREAAVRLAMDRTVLRLTMGPVPAMPNSDSIRQALDTLRDMRLRQRHLLDHSMFLYMQHSGYSLCTRRGGQFAVYHPDWDIVERFNYLRAENPAMRSFTAFRHAYFGALLDGEVPVLTFYHQVVGTLPEPGFVAINLDVNALASYLRGVDIGGGTRFVMIDGQGSIIMDTDRPVVDRHISSHISSLVGYEIHGPEGNMTVEIAGDTMRLSWMDFPGEDWTLMKFIPLEDYMVSMHRLRNFIFWSVAISLPFSALIAFLATLRLFRPVSDIIRIVENPSSYSSVSEINSEINLLLMSVLESFQKNIVLEKEMLQKVSALRDSKTIALQKQISPHFLYNTLQVLNWLAIAETKEEDSNTSKAIIALADMVHDSMEYNGNFTTINKEIEHVQKYMEIIHLSYGEEIQLIVNCDQLITENEILRLTLQPLVENAIQHGLQASQGTIYMDIAVRDEQLCISVEDDGTGMDESSMQEYNRMLESEDIYINQNIGLLNVCQRIKLVYGDEYGINLSKSGHGGLRVEIKMELGFGKKNNTTSKI